MAQVNFNRAPYYDDHNTSSNYVRVLFKDGVPLQARELNNIQSAFQAQIRMFGEHVFKNGSCVSGGRKAAIDYDFIAIESLSPFTGKPVDWESFQEGWVLQGRVTRLKARLVKVEGPRAENFDRIMLYLAYSGSAIDGETRAFLPGEPVDFVDADGNVFFTVSIKCPNCEGSQSDQPASVGKGTIFVIEDGTFFYSGMFIETSRQHIVVSHTSAIKDSTISIEVGYRVDFSVVTADDDETINDISLGYPNKTSPGADRYKVDLVLDTRVNMADEKEFIPLMAWSGGNVSFIKEFAEYSVIQEELARRTYEESGDYTVYPYDITFVEHKKIDAAGSDENFAVKITPTTHYVKGWRVQNSSDRYVVASKARGTNSLLSYAKQFNETAYIVLNPKSGSSAYAGSGTNGSVNDGSLVELYNGPLNLNANGSFLPTGSKIGTMRISDMALESGVPGTDSAAYRYNAYDVKFDQSKSFNDVESVFHPTNKFVATPVRAAGQIKSGNGASTGFIWPVGKDNIKSLRDAQNSAKGSITYATRVKLSGQADSQGVITFNTRANEIFTGFTDKTVMMITTNGVPATVDHSSFTATVTANSIVVNLGQANSGKQVTLVTNAIRTKTTERKKSLRVTTDTITSISMSDSMFLSKADVRRVVQVVAYNRNDSTGAGTEIDVSTFTMSTGQTDNYYSNGSIAFAPGKSLPTDIANRITDYGLRVSYEYFEHSSSAGALTVDSYSQLIADGVMEYKHIPVYVSVNGSTHSLANSFDFRPLMINGSMKECNLPSMNDMAFFDVEYYLPRIDVLQVDSDGAYSIVTGIPNDQPIPPKAKTNAMALAEVHIPAYVYDVVDIRRKKIETKRYTMKDISRLDGRLKNVEYYTALNILETSAADMSIKDVNGLDRFKNGFVVDDFSEFQAADLDSAEFSAANDVKTRTLRPSFGMKNRKLKLSGVDSHMQLINGMLMKKFTETVANENLHATKSISVNPYHVYTRVGKVALDPAIDTWCDVTTEPALIMTQDFGTEAFAKAAGRMDSMWGAWRSTSVSVVDTTAASLQETSSGSVTQRGNTTTHDMGERLTDIHIEPYIRENLIKISATNLAPNTQIYAFFDGKAVWKHCRPANGSWGDDLVTNSQGEFFGEFRIPPQTFFVGEKKFKLTGSPSNSNDSDSVITTATGTYYAAGMNTSKQSMTFNAIRPELDASNLVGGQTGDVIASTEAETISNVGNTQVVGFVEVPDKTQLTVTTTNTSMVAGSKNEPIAQSFYLESDAFVTSFDVYFAQIDLAGGNIWFEIRPTYKGVPSTVVLDRIEVNPAQITPSDDASVPFKVTLSVPLFVKAHDHYVMVVGGSSPLNRIWVSKVGDPLIDSPGKVMETQGSFGVSFRSQNGRTWTTDQWEDLKYTVRVAEFHESDFTAIFEIDSDEPTILSEDALECSAGSSHIRVYAPDHACSAGDTVALMLNEGGTFKATLFDHDMPVTIRSTLFANKSASSHTGMCVVRSATHESANVQVVEFENLEGTFSNGDALCRDDGVVFATVLSSFDQTLNGVPVSALCKSHGVIAVDSKNTFVIDAGTPATSSGRFGGKAKCVINTVYDAYNVCGSIMAYNSAEKWNIQCVAHDHYQSGNLPFTDYAITSPMPFKINSDNELIQSMKLVTSNNGTNFKTKVLVTMKTPTTAVSPVISTKTLSAVLINNRIGQETTRMDIEPNSFERWKDEQHASLGVETYKYVSKQVRLTKPAGDLLIMADVNSPVGTNFNIYYRKLGSADSREITNVAWTKIPLTKTHGTSFIEHEVYLSHAFAQQWANEEFISSFQIKIVGQSENSANIPLFKNLRIIAVT